MRILPMIVATSLLAACSGSNRADRYQSPPNDNSPGMNSADVVTEPGITPAAGTKPSKRPKADTPDVVDRPQASAITVPPERLRDPLTERPIGGAGEPGHYGRWELRFESPETATKFASLPKARRASLAAAQVLPQRGIPNHTCPLTSVTLTADAVPVTFDHRTYGFANATAAQRFRSLPSSEQLTVIEEWMHRGGT